MHILKIGRFILFAAIFLVFISACSSSRESTGGLSPSIASVLSSQVNAGDIDDNARWDIYLNYRDGFLESYGSSVHNVDVSGRRVITVTDADGLPVEGAAVLVFAGETLVSETQTYADGKTLFFPNTRPESANVQSFRVVVQKNDAAVQFTLNSESQAASTVVLKTAAAVKQNTPLDVMFLLDATGSMSDEIAQLQNNILRISAQVGKLTDESNIRYGLVTYRDRGDDYITHIYDFTPDVSAFQANLNTVSAGGGGDIPESLNEGLHNAVQDVQWRGADTVKLIFLVSDAAPHLDYANDYDYTQEMAIAAAKGIKIHPIASSGLEADGEFIFRQIAQYTMGHFLFLTYQQGATSGAAGDTRTDLHVGDPINPQTQQGDYTVEQLDDLVLQLIKNEMAALTIPVASQPNVTAKTVPPVPSMAAPLPQIIQPNGVRMDLPAPIPVTAPALNMNLLFVLAIVVIIVLSMVVGYLLSTRQPIYKEKRKNEELGIEIDA
ncbi:MAG: vWA domain-containing protein [Chloroflexota bacterium]